MGSAPAAETLVGLIPEELTQDGAVSIRKIMHYTE